MSNISDEKVFDRAVDLIVHQDQMLQNWTTRYIAVEGGLMLAVATLIQWRVSTPSLLDAQYSSPFVAAQSLLALLGILAAWLITRMIANELEWQKNYVLATKRAEGDDPTLYPFEVKPGPGRTLKLFQRASWLLTVLWLVLLAIIILLPIPSMPASATP